MVKVVGNKNVYYDTVIGKPTGCYHNGIDVELLFTLGITNEKGISNLSNIVGQIQIYLQEV